jgi:uncharacterized protein YbdZ (MbtH family)
MHPVETLAGPRHRTPGWKQVVHYSCAEQHHGWNLTPVEREVRVSRWLSLLLPRYCTSADVPAGWQMVYGEAARAVCLDNAEQNCTEIRPISLRQRLAQGRDFEM